MKKKILFLTISIFLVILILFSSSYALLFKVDETDKQSYTTGILDITSESLSGSVTINNQLPMSDSDGENSTPYIFRITNTGNLSYKFNIMLLSTTTDNQIEAQYIKVKVNDNEIVTLNSLTNGVILSEIVLEPTEYIDVTLRVWLDINTPNTQIGKTFNAKITTEGQAIYTKVNLDKSGANEPDLVDGLIPVVYNESTSNWVKADSTNSTSTYQWYDYNNKLWANAVLVSETGFDYPKTSKDVNISNQTVPAYASSNQNQNSTTSTSTFTITTGSTAGTLSFDYAVSSESGYDKLTITVNDTTVADAISGTKSDTYSVSATANTTYTIVAKYVKDSISSSGTDTATISNLTYPSGSTLSITPDATYPFNEISALGNKIASSFTYDTSTSKYTLNNTTNDTISSSTVDKYICPDITKNTCSTMYKVTTASTAITKVEEYGTPTIHIARNKYLSAAPGTIITESDILAFYVWIPRYKYKVWNINKVIGTDSYNAQNIGIDIVFENDIESTGTINCEYNYNVNTSNEGIDLSTTTAETCTGSDGEYYTHPAFTFGNDEVRGFWIGKFELSSSEPTESYGGGETTNLTARILPNVTSWRYNKLSNFNTVIQNMQASNNIYGLNTSRTNTDSHMITNMEWGAVAYLTNSKYGRCTNNSCTEVTVNNCSNYVTGIGGNSINESSSSSNCTTETNKYNGAKGVLASTTGNIAGVYDMSGGAREYVMGNMSHESGSYTLYSASSGFSGNWYTVSTAKYLTTYAYDGDNDINDVNQTAYNRSRLGDAIGEIVLSSGSGWYSESVNFLYSHMPSVSYMVWFERSGCIGTNDGAGVFRSRGSYGYSIDYNSSRAILVSLAN